MGERILYMLVGVGAVLVIVAGVQIESTTTGID
jgi:uncharacterized membrane protein YuzA (DUF378 family)